MDEGEPILSEHSDLLNKLVAYRTWGRDALEAPDKFGGKANEAFEKAVELKKSIQKAIKGNKWGSFDEAEEVLKRETKPISVGFNQETAEGLKDFFPKEEKK